MTELIILIFIYFVSSILSLFIYRNNPKSATNIAFLFAAVSIAFWSTIMYLSLHPPSIETTLFYIRFSMLAGSVLATSFLLLAITFPHTRFPIKKIYLVPIVGFSIITMIVAMSPFMFTDLVVDGGNISPTAGPGIIFFILNAIGYNLATIIIFVVKYRRSKGHARDQLRYVILGIVLMFLLLIVANFLLVVIFKSSALIFLGPLFTLTFLSTTAYSILKHRLLDIDLIVARTVSYSLLLFVFISIYISSLYGLANLIPNINFHPNQIAIFMILSILIVVTINPLRELLEKLTDSIFFKGHYDTEGLLGDLTHTMASEINLKTLGDELLVMLLRQMRITRGAFVVIDNEKISSIISQGFNDAETLKSLELIRLSKTKEEIILFEELSSSVSDTKDLFRDLEITTVLPLRVKRESIGLLVLGPKSSGDIYSNQDIELLTIFAPQAAIAMKNAQSYRQIQEFSKTLEKKVEERTKELKETQKRELSKAKELLKLKDEFVFIATHDLRTPVTAINGFIELIREETNTLPSSIKEDIDAIKQASDRLNQLVDDLLEVARSESGTIKIESKQVDFIKIAQNSIKQVTPAATERKIKINTNFDSTHKLVMADEEKLSEIMENLLSNAVKYNKDRGSINVRTKKSDNMLMIEVMDTGFGIPKDKHDKVFQKFFRAQQEGTEGIPGTGLGLFVVRMLIEKMKGKISFVSTEGEGTTFVFTLPLAK